MASRKLDEAPENKLVSYIKNEVTVVATKEVDSKIKVIIRCKMDDHTNSFLSIN